MPHFNINKRQAERAAALAGISAMVNDLHSNSGTCDFNTVPNPGEATRLGLVFAEAYAASLRQSATQDVARSAEIDAHLQDAIPDHAGSSATDQHA